MMKKNQLKVHLFVVFTAGVMFLPMQLKADEVVPLYVEDGNIQVSKVVKRTALGGEVVEYVKTRIDPSLAEKQTQQSGVSLLNKGDVAHAKAKITAVENLRVKEGRTKLTAQLVDVDSVPIVQLPDVLLKKDVESSSRKEKTLLKRFKALNAVKNKKESHDSLGLTSDEKLIIDESKKSIKLKSKRVRRTHKRMRAEDAIISRLEFNRANILDVARALADISNLNFVATEEAAKKDVTIFLKNISVINALEAVTKNTGLWYRKDKDSGTFRIMTTGEYQRDLVVYREDITRVFNLLHPNPVNVATAVRDLYGGRVLLSYGADYDDFFTGEFNSGGGSNTNSNGGNQSRANGGSAGRGQSGLRRGITSGISSNRNGGSGNHNRGNAEALAGTAGNMAITEQLSASQLERLEEAVEVDENGDKVIKGAIRSISRAQQPIYITISKQQNLMIVRTSDAIAVKEIESLVKEMDKPTQQVLLEMQILEIDVGDAYNQLFSFTALSKNSKSLAFTREDSERSNAGKFVYQFIDDLIGFKLELLEKNNQAKTVSSPILLASNNRTARLFVGEERLLIRGATLTDAVIGQNANIITPARITYETELRNVGNTLNITPKINANGTVTLGIFQDSSTVNKGAVDFPPLVSNGQVVNIKLDTINTANIEGVIVAKDGLTVAIGGLIRNSASKGESKVPILGDIPIIGNAFKDKYESVTQTEMVLLITPHIIKEPAATDDVSRDVIEPISSQQW